MASGAPQKVFVDLAPLAPDGSNGGAAVLVLRLLRALLARPDAHEYHLLVKPFAESAVSGLIGAGAILHRLGPGLDVEEPRRLLREMRRLPDLLARVLPDAASLTKCGAGILFSPLGSAAFHEPRLLHVAVIHDGFQELTFPGFFSDAEKRRRHAFRSDLKRIDLIVAVSETARAEALGRLGVKGDRIIAVPNTVGLANIRASAPGDLPSDPRLVAGSYLLYPANAWPHKNHPRLIRAFARASRRMEEAKLVLCGDFFRSLDGLRRLAADESVGDRVVFLPYLPEREAWALIRSARFLVFPSLYEGFGIPVLEAMALGTPVACSDLPVLREVAGDAALFFDPNDEASIADTLARLWESGPARETLADAGRRRADRYAALDVVGTYHRLLAG